MDSVDSNIIINMLKDSKYTEIVNFCNINKYFTKLCSLDDFWAGFVSLKPKIYYDEIDKNEYTMEELYIVTEIMEQLSPNYNNVIIDIDDYNIKIIIFLETFNGSRDGTIILELLENNPIITHLEYIADDYVIIDDFLKDIEDLMEKNERLYEVKVVWNLSDSTEHVFNRYDGYYKTVDYYGTGVEMKKLLSTLHDEGYHPFISRNGNNNSIINIIDSSDKGFTSKNSDKFLKLLSDNIYDINIFIYTTKGDVNEAEVIKFLRKVKKIVQDDNNLSDVVIIRDTDDDGFSWNYSKEFGYETMDRRKLKRRISITNN